MRLAIFIFGALIITMSSCSGDKNAVVDVTKLYSEFQMTKELEQSLEQNLNAKNVIMDSLKFAIQRLEVQLNANATDLLIQQYELKKQEYVYTEQKFIQENERLSQQYYEQALKQINAYVQDYGKEQGYSYIFGATGSGSIMYTNEANDLTEELIAFINQKYQGKS